MLNLQRLQLFGIVLSWAAAIPAQAQTTTYQIPYQGRLDLDGVAMNGQYDLQFELYTSDTLGDCGVPPVISGYCVWADEHVDVQGVSGDFSVALGSTSPLGDAVWQNVEVFLGMRAKGPTDNDYTQLWRR